MLKDKETTEKLTILKNDVAYLSDIFFMLNESNKQLQGNNMTMVNVIMFSKTTLYIHYIMYVYMKTVFRRWFLNPVCFYLRYSLSKNMFL